MGIQASSGSALASGHTRSAVTKLSGAGQDLSTGNQSKDSSKLALAASLSKNLSESRAYLNNVGIAASNVAVARSALDNIKAQVLEMKSLAVQAQSASGSQLGTLNTLYTQKRTLVDSLVANAEFNGDTFFVNDTSTDTFQVSATVAIAADMNANGTTSLSNSLTIGGGNALNAAATKSSSAAAVANTSILSVTISGKVAVSGGGNTNGVLTNGSILTVLSGTTTVAIGGSTYYFSEGDSFNFSTITNSIIAYSSATDLSGAGNTAVILTNGSFSGVTTDTNAGNIVLTNKGQALVAGTPFTGTDISTSGNASSAVTSIDVILGYVSAVETKLIAMESSLSGFGADLEAKITAIADTEEKLRSVDITDSMADIVAASGQAKAAMSAWQANQALTNNAMDILQRSI